MNDKIVTQYHVGTFRTAHQAVAEWYAVLVSEDAPYLDSYYREALAKYLAAQHGSPPAILPMILPMILPQLLEESSGELDEIPF